MEFMIALALLGGALAWFDYYTRPGGPAYERARRRRVWSYECMNKGPEEADAYMVKNYGEDWRNGKEPKRGGGR
jgi:hypothetical protein